MVSQEITALPEWMPRYLHGDWQRVGPLWVGVVRITQNSAQYVIHHHTNKPNRNLVPSNMHRLRSAMMSGQFRLTGETIIFDLDGDLIDGQHRVRCCAATGVTIDVLAVYGASPGTFDVLGQGAKRTLQNVLASRGEKDASGLGAAISYLHLYMQTGMLYRSDSEIVARLTIEDNLQILDDNPGLRDSASFIHNRSMVTKYAGGAGLSAAMHYICGLHSNRLANAFFDTLQAVAKAKVGEHSLTPRWAVMCQLFRILNTNYNASRKFDMKGMSCLLIRAWNAMLEGRQIKNLMYRVGDKYPLLAGWKYSDDGLPIAPIPEDDGVEIPDFLME